MEDIDISTAIAVLQERNELQHTQTMGALAEIKGELARMNGTSRDNSEAIAALLQWKESVDKQILRLDAVTVKASITGDVISALAGVLAAVAARFIP